MPESSTNRCRSDGGAYGVSSLSAKLRYWDYEEVLSVHSSLEGVNEAINKLGLVPQGFAS